MNSSQISAQAIPMPEEKTEFYVSPRAGTSMMNVNSAFTVSGHFSLGVAGGVAISDNLAFELGYTYSEYGIGYGNAITNLYAAGTQFDAYTLKQNVIDANLKLYFLGRESKLRPFITGGFGYAIGYLNYPSNVQSINQGLGSSAMAQDYKSNAYLGSIGAGLDVKVNKTISIGAQFKYYTVLSVNENNNLYYGAYGGNSAFLNPMAGGADPNKAIQGASLAQSSFYSLTGGLTFAF
jgi:outer membrane protein W